MRITRIVIASAATLIGIAGITACGGDGSGIVETSPTSGPTTSTPTSTTTATTTVMSRVGTVTLEKWSTEVAALCADQADAIDELDEPPVDAEDVTEGDLPDVAVYLRQVHGLILQTVDDIAAMQQPDGFETDAEDLRDGLNDVVAAVRDARDAAADDDLEGFHAASKSVVERFEALEPVYEILDVEECRL